MYQHVFLIPCDLIGGQDPNLSCPLWVATEALRCDIGAGLASKASDNDGSMFTSSLIGLKQGEEVRVTEKR